MTRAYYDANYLFKLLANEAGSPEVRAHATHVSIICCSLHGRAEFASACHRKLRENAATPEQVRALLAQLGADADAGGLLWLPVNEAVIARVERIFSTAPAATYLRAADGLHLASAAENGFTEIYSNDRHLLAAAPLFGLQGFNLIS